MVQIMCSRIRATCLLFVFVLVVVSECNSEGFDPVPNCARYDCPSYNVIHSQTYYEIRSYNNSRWVSAPPVSSNSYKKASDKGFLILFSYYNGNNRQQMTINMTAPVLVDVQNSTYTVYFYVPKNNQKYLPTPLSKGIKSVTLPNHKYAAVRRFDGYITDENILEEVALLKKSLRGSPYSRAADLDLFTLAGYNSPFELTHRVNEVIIWFD